MESIGRYFHDTTQKLIAENSFTLVGGMSFGVDVIKNVIRLVPVYWAASDLVSRSWTNTSCTHIDELLLGWHSTQDKAKSWRHLHPSGTLWNLNRYLLVSQTSVFCCMCCLRHSMTVLSSWISRRPRFVLPNIRLKKPSRICYISSRLTSVSVTGYVRPLPLHCTFI